MDKTFFDIDLLFLAASPLVNDINEIPFEWIINVDKELIEENSDIINNS